MLDLLLLELVLVVALLLLAGAARRHWATPFQRFERRFDALARRRASSILLVIVLCLSLRLALLPVLKIPTPGVHDEFSYLLAADTFASGRLTNPTHPMWVHFETFHVNQRPTYHSIYQPAQGLVLAAGKVLLGHPWFGAWISTGVMCGAITWALYGWLPPRWALLGGLIAIMRLGIFSYWMNSYWGGAVPATGGALVVGTLPRLMHRPRVPDALWMAFGIAILASSRPYEGAVLTLAAAAVLARWVVRQRKRNVDELLGRIVLPMAVVLLLTAAGLMYYFWRLTGNPFEIPYQLNRETYAVSQPFYWQKIPPIPTFRHKVMSDYYLGVDLDWYVRGSSLTGRIAHWGADAQFLWLFYLGPILLVPVAMFGSVVRDRRIRPLWPVTLGCVLSIGLEAWRTVPHYAAPMTAAIYVLLLQGIRHWRAVNRRTAGPLLAWGVPLICAVMLVVRAGAEIRPVSRYLSVDGNAWWCFVPGGIADRDRILRELGARPGEHLVLVLYRNLHDPRTEWVYNGADIDRQKVVWARNMGDANNRELLQYYSGRQIWTVEADAPQPELVPYSSRATLAPTQPGFSGKPIWNLRSLTPHGPGATRSRISQSRHPQKCVRATRAKSAASAYQSKASPDLQDGHKTA